MLTLRSPPVVFAAGTLVEADWQYSGAESQQPSRGRGGLAQTAEGAVRSAEQIAGNLAAGPIDRPERHRTRNPTLLHLPPVMI